MNSIKIHFADLSIKTITTEMTPMQGQIVMGPAGNVLEVKDSRGEMVAEIPINLNVLWIESDLQTTTNV